MSGTTVSNGTTTFTPTLVHGYESSRATATVVHQILGRSAPNVSIRPAALRTGTLELIFANGEIDSKACEDAHAAGGVFTLSSTEASTIPMSYVANGAIARALDDTRAVWILRIDFHEVGP
jgi:hypothetical protein